MSPRKRPPWPLAAIVLAVAVLAVLAGRSPGVYRAMLEHFHPRELLAGGNSPPAPRVSPETERLDAAALELAARYAGEHGSLALIVSRHEHIVFERYWAGSGFDTPADAQSFTRLLAALAAGAAYSYHLIGWPDQPVSAFIPEWSHDPRGEITVRNLLQMTSGLAGGRSSTARDLPAALLHTPLARTPGAVRSDQASDPQLLALVIERASGQRYASYLSQAIWRRIGAADAWLRLDHTGGTAYADCCMIAHQGDWIRIGQLLLRDGNYRGDEVIRPGWVALMRTPGQSDPQYGAYVRVRWPMAAAGHEPPAARDLFAVEGEGGNRLWMVPSLELAILCTGSTAGRDAGWDDNHLPNLVIAAARDALPPAAQPGADISAIVPGH
ncbi:MAG TPA: serine hydrolase [Steroidobacteraceae bacterium]|nr:serine hydrolase [Steroidobacteraceae bacterium]